jgi:four helix bundle protein
MRYEEWAETVPETIRRDPLWARQDYRLSLYIADEGWEDVRRLSEARASSVLADQLCRALGSISANIAEGHSRASGPDRARFYEYALGSARESRDWYHKAARALDPGVVRRRLHVLTSIVRLLTYAIPRERGAIHRMQNGPGQGGTSRLPVCPRVHPARDARLAHGSDSRSFPRR